MTQLQSHKSALVHYANHLIDILHNWYLQVDALENKLLLYSTALEVYKADELFNQLADNGDPFPLLNAIEPDEVGVGLH